MSLGQPSYLHANTNYVLSAAVTTMLTIRKAAAPMAAGVGTISQRRFAAVAGTTALNIGFNRKAAPFTAATTVQVDSAALQAALDDVCGTPGSDHQAFVTAKKHALEEELTTLTKSGGELCKLVAKYDSMSGAAADHAHRAMWGTFLFLLAQNAVLFQWVFITFDWNLVEPMTYFLGYTANTWLALVFFKSTGRDFTYDAIVAELKEKRMATLTASDEDFSLTRLQELQAREASLRASLAQL